MSIEIFVLSLHGMFLYCSIYSINVILVSEDDKTKIPNPINARKRKSYQLN